MNKTLIITFKAFLLFLAVHTQAFSQNDTFKIGTATKIINHEIGSWVQGATRPVRATEIRGNLEANGIYFSKGRFQLLMISCDLGGLESSFAVRLREAIGVAAGIPPRNILISCTHARGPSLLRTNYLMPLDTAYMERLEGWLKALAVEAAGSARPAEIGWARGEVHIGFNRRLTWADGTHTMGGNASRSDFTGLEGPDDPQHVAMFARDLDGELIAVIWNNTSHIPIYYGAGIFTPELPGEVRELIRDITGKNLPVLFLNGAQGDITLNDALNPEKETNEEKMVRLRNLVVSETMALYEEAVFYSDPELRHDYHDLKVSVRLPETEQLIEGRKILKRIDEGENIRGMEMIMAFGSVLLQDEYGDNPFDILPVHAVRIGELAIVTQPCELYCQFGLDIKRRSPAEATIVVGLTNGYGGYCPTIYGVIGGGYTGTPIAWTRLEPYAGYKIVNTASRLLYGLW